MKNLDRNSGNAAPPKHLQHPVSRRALLRGVLGGAGAAVLAGSGNDAVRAFPSPAQFHQNDSPADVVVFPRPGSKTASSHTQISFRQITIDQLASVRVTGSRSGGHTGVLQAHSDGRGASFLPDAPFWTSELVTVETDLRDLAAPGHSFTFTTAAPASSEKSPTSKDAKSARQAPRTFRSRPDLRPPSMFITTPIPPNNRGHIFLAAKVTAGQNGAMILDDQGELVWFHPLSPDIVSIDNVCVQQYQGQPVLTWWEGVGPIGHGRGHYVIYDTSYRPIATVRAGNGYAGADLHEFVITPRGTALFTIYNPIRWNITAAGGPIFGAAIDGIIQEVDIATGLVVFEWHSLEQIGVEESYAEPSTNPGAPFDYLHPNSIDVLDDDSLLLSARHTWAIYKIDGHNGDIVWRLNGKQSDFKMGPGAATAYQHDARMHPGNLMSIFDNHASVQGEAKHSRGIVLKLDLEKMTADLEREYIHPTDILSVSQGSLQLLPNGNAFIGWGSAPVLSEFDPDGNLIFNERFPVGDMSYRAFRLPWTGQPADRPAIAVLPKGPDSATVYVSWNGATEIARWQVLAGPTPDQLSPLHSAPKAGFETALTVRTTERYVAAHALDAEEKLLGTSEAALVSQGRQDQVSTPTPAP